MAGQTEKVVAAAGLVSVTVGSLNSILKYKQAPSMRFLIGSGVAWIVLSLMAQSDSLGELAQGLSLGIMSTIILGDGGGVLTYFVGEQEVNTQKRAPQGEPISPTTPPTMRHIIVTPHGATYRRDAPPPQPFHPAH